MAERKEYIEKNLLKEYVNGVSTHWLNDWSTIGVLAAIDKQPVKDAVEVVRCKDCAKRKTPDCPMHYECNCGEQHTWETDEDFCSSGVRKNT